jgi:hypothetical protein
MCGYLLAVKRMHSLSMLGFDLMRKKFKLESVLPNNPMYNCRLS